MIALGLELQRRGHEAVIATSEPTTPHKITTAGLGFPPDPPGHHARSDKDLLRRTMHERLGPEHVIRRHDGAGRARHLRGSERGGAWRRPARWRRTGLYAARLSSPRSRRFRGSASRTGAAVFMSVHDPPVLPQAPRLARHCSNLEAGVCSLVMLSRSGRPGTGASRCYRMRAELGLPRGLEPALRARQHAAEALLGMFSPIVGAATAGLATECAGHRIRILRSSRGDARCSTAFLDAGEPRLSSRSDRPRSSIPASTTATASRRARRLGGEPCCSSGRNRRRAASDGPADRGRALRAVLGIVPRVAAVVHQGGIGTTGRPCAPAGRC